MSFCLELFACSGGMAAGFRAAGVTFDLVVDKDPNAVESYAQNLGHRPLHMDARDFLRLLDAGARFPPVELLVADPPCTPWSNAGKRQGLADERDMMRVTIEIIRRLRPRTYLIGNVPGLETAPNLAAVHSTIGSLAKDGYCVADAAVLDAANYGVPQHRVRPFWFGHLEGPCLRWPAPTHAAPSTTLPIDGTELQPWITVREALAHLPPEEIGRLVRLRYRGAAAGDPNARAKAGKKPRASRSAEPAETIRAKDSNDLVWSEEVDDRPNRADEPSKTITASGRGHNGACIVEGLLTHPRHPPSREDAPSHTITAKGNGRGAQGACVVQVDAWPWDRPATTVMSDERLAPPGHHPESGSWLSRPATTVMAGNDVIGGPGKGSICTRPQAVKITERAAAILQGFPEDWVFHGRTKKARWSQIGQAMPPPLAEAVARAIVVRAKGS